MNDPRNTFSTSEIADPAALKAHAALYGALDSTVREEPAVIVARPRPIPQGGAAVARALRARLIAETRAAQAMPAVSTTRQRSENNGAAGAQGGAVAPERATSSGGPAERGPFTPVQPGADRADEPGGPGDGRPRPSIPSAAILRFRLSELPRLAGQFVGRNGETQGRDNGRDNGREAGPAAET
ncbi:hypothetical protein [Phreatobacter stygius]|uniref:Uncharacterized protein n=1 Tax=Phreatobacter stygius TaxID=1940610 RepID=A0A4D7AP87_9HYPH|nr:hypothetical protein [Phreatobacter stygius]QCI62799.1 hypothetical protein E8M01_00205 [Phreatobacter stygius]